MEDAQPFLDRCVKLRDQALAQLEGFLVETDLQTCAELTIMLGQVAPDLNAVTGASNAFSSELELVSTGIRSYIRTGALTVESVMASYAALVSARRVLVFEQMTTWADQFLDTRTAKGGIGSLFQTEWLSRRGKFVGAFDFRYLSRLVDNLRARGIEVPDPAGVQHALIAFLNRWRQVLSRYCDALPESAVTKTVIGTHGLLHEEQLELSELEIKLLCKALPALSLSGDAIAMAAPRELSEEVLQWVDALSLDSSALSGDRKYDLYALSPLRAYPILVGAEGFMLTSPHRLTADLSTLTDEVWGRRYGEPYFAARGATVEELALETVRALAPNASGFAQGVYSSRSGEIRGEVDAVAVWRDVCIVFEGKGGFLSLAARRGSTEAVLADLFNTISHGYYQAARLIRLISAEKEVVLQGGHGSTFALNRKSLRRAYVVVPTADHFGDITTRLEFLWSNKVLPEGSAPVIISVQDLMLLCEVLGDMKEFVAYLDFREEILRNSWISFHDEREILGAYVGGRDAVTSGMRQLRESGLLRDSSRIHLVSINPVQEERYLTPWITQKYGKDLTGDDSVPAPIRHTEQTLGQLKLVWESTQDVAAYTSAAALSPEMLKGILQTAVHPRGRRPVVETHDYITSVSYHGLLGLQAARRHPDVKAATRVARYVIFMEHSGAGARLSHAERGRRHACFREGKVGFALQSHVAIHDPWFTWFEGRRKRHFDRVVVAALEVDGLPRDLAIGVARYGISDQVRELASHGVAISRAAELWLGTIRRIATDFATPVDQLVIDASSLVEVLRYVDRGGLAHRDVKTIIAAVVDGAESVHDVIRAMKLPSEVSSDVVSEAVADVAAAHPDAVDKFAAGHRGVENFLIGQVMRQLGGRAQIDSVRSALVRYVAR
ncbi:GatB/YqeY domain-containing protein [Streptosporangium roseum]|uniref:GatB/YqeY domain-containing protein n=1 Tax=Streptosporangium roseum TaxID=2001 RepID=UPI001469E760|nr:GatB/YqeY domain-containing protein [Streptosporangium roseum]